MVPFGAKRRHTVRVQWADRRLRAGILKLADGVTERDHQVAPLHPGHPYLVSAAAEPERHASRVVPHVPVEPVHAANHDDLFRPVREPRMSAAGNELVAHARCRREIGVERAQQHQPCRRQIPVAVGVLDEDFVPKSDSDATVRALILRGSPQPIETVTLKLEPRGLHD